MSLVKGFSIIQSNSDSSKPLGTQDCPRIQDISLVKIEDLRFKADWRAFEDDVEEATYLFVSETGVLAEIILFEHSPTTVYIDSFETKVKGKGIGTVCINYLKQCCRQHNILLLSGDSVPEAVYFWEKLGAQFESLNEQPPTDYPTLLPFKIYL